ncbi:hypothetical protein M3F34_008125 [Micrococcus luteus]|nr:hypothetical protein [Micrococcus luteus]
MSAPKTPKSNPTALEVLDDAYKIIAAHIEREATSEDVAATVRVLGTLARKRDVDAFQAQVSGVPDTYGNDYEDRDQLVMTVNSLCADLLAFARYLPKQGDH